MLLKDEQARITAVENTDKNIIVEAGAGTGKTTLLVKKIMFLLFVKKVKLSRLIALTFTKKAAASLKQKLEEELFEAYQTLLFSSFVLTANDNNFAEQLNTYPKEKQDVFGKFRPLFIKSGLSRDDLFALIKTALEEVPLCQIGTIHSFCVSLLKKYALEAGLNTKIDIKEEDVFNIIFDKYWASFLDEELNLNSPHKETWLALLKEVNLSNLKNFAAALCSPIFENFNPQDNLPFIINEIQGHIQETEFLLQNHPEGNDLVNCLRNTLKRFQEQVKFCKGEIKGFEELDFSVSFRKSYTGWEKEEKHHAKHLIEYAKNNIVKNQTLFQKAYDLLHPFVLKVKEEMLKQNYLSFDEIITKTHHLLLNNKSVRQELKLSYDSIFIDEFQDTDPIQGEIMLFLAETPETFATAWRDLQLTSGKLFIVGDPKQSIYHFRGADISAYQDFCNLLKKQGAITCVLQNNFRSAKEIIDFVNYFGKSQIKYVQHRQSAYQEIYHSKAFSNASVELYCNTLEDLNKENLRPIFAQTIAKWICDNVHKTIKSDGTPLQYKDIAILLPTATEINIFLSALKDNNIPYNVEEDGNFYSSQEILDLLNILKVLKNPQDKVALLGVLRSPIGLINDLKLLNLSNQDKLNIYAETQDEQVQKIYEKLKTLKAKVSNLNPVEIVNEILEIFNFTSYQALASLNEQTLANIAKFKQVVTKLFANGAYTLEQLLYNFENYQKESEKESSAILAEENFNVVKVLTIHKAKGLEYPVVILTDLSKDFTKKNPKKRKIAFYSRAMGLKSIALGTIKNYVISKIEENDKLQEFEERKRLLYVAMTRAKERLILVDSLQSANNTYSQFLYDAGCWPTPAKEETLITSKVFYQNILPPEEDFNAHNEHTETSFNFNFPLWKGNFENRNKEYNTYLENGQKLTLGTATIFKTPAVEYAIKVGSLCHKILQNIFSKIPNSLEYETDKDAIKEAQSIVDDFCKTPVFEELKNMECLATELPFTVLENGIVKNGIVDALFRAKNGKLMLIDFKSDKIEVVNAKTVEPKYLEQLSFYKNALSKVFQGKIDTGLVYLRPAKMYKIEE